MLIGVPIISLSRKIHFCSCKFHTRHCIAEIVFAATENVLERFQLTFQAQVQYVCTVPELTLDVFADVLAPNGSKPSTGTILGEKSLMFSSQISGQQWFRITFMNGMMSLKMTNKISLNPTALRVVSYMTDVVINRETWWHSCRVLIHNYIVRSLANKYGINDATLTINPIKYAHVCVFLLCLHHGSLWIHMIYTAIVFRVASLNRRWSWRRHKNVSEEFFSAWGYHMTWNYMNFQ